MFELWRQRSQTKLKFCSSSLLSWIWTDILCQFDTSFILSSCCFHKLISPEYNWYSTSNVCRLCKSRDLLTLIWQNSVIQFCYSKLLLLLHFYTGTKETKFQNGISLGISIYVDRVKWTSLFTPKVRFKFMS